MLARVGRERTSRPAFVTIPAVTTAESGLCANCGTGLTGPFCHRCGQEAVERRLPLRRLPLRRLPTLLLTLAWVVWSAAAS